MPRTQKTGSRSANGSDDVASRRQAIVVVDSPRASNDDRERSDSPQPCCNADAPQEGAAAAGSSTPDGGVASARGNAVAAAPLQSGAADSGNGHTGAGTTECLAATLLAGSTYRDAATPAGYCAALQAPANRSAGSGGQTVLRRTQSQDGVLSGRPPSPAESASRSLGELACDELLFTPGDSILPAPCARHPQQQQQPPSAFPSSPSHAALATPPLTATAPHSAASSLQSLPMDAADGSALVEPAQHGIDALHVEPAAAEPGTGGNNDVDACGRFIVHKPHTPPASNTNSRSSRSSDGGRWDARPMSSIILVAATEENSGPAQHEHQQQRETNWFRRQSKSSAASRRPSQTPSTAPSLGDQTAHYESLMLKAQEQRNAAMAEAAALQQQLDEQRRAYMTDIGQLRRDLDTTTRRLGAECERRMAAEAKCSLMECELAELSSNIQLEAQNMVAHERREHKAELERMVRRHDELVQLMDMERAQVGALKQGLERTTRELDAERDEAVRLRTGMVAFERQMASLIGPARGSSSNASPTDGRDSLSPAQSSRSAKTVSSDRAARSTPPSLDGTVAAASEPHITGQIYFGGDAVRADTRLAEFLGFINAASDKEAQASIFMQRSMREDVGPTLATDAAGMPLLPGWSKHRRLLHCVQDTSLVLESYAPRVPIGRVLSPACYLCRNSITRLADGLLADHLPAAPEHRASGRAHCEMYRMRFGDDDTDNKALCAHCHARMVTVCSFFAYLKIVRRGLIKRPIADIWLEVNRARLQMWLARSGASADSSLTVAAA